MGNIQLKDIKTLKEVADKYKIPIKTLQFRLKNLEEGIDYKKLGKRQPTILTPLGVEKLINNVVKSNKRKTKLNQTEFIKEYERFKNKEYGKITTHDFAKILGISYTTLYQYIKKYDL